MEKFVSMNFHRIISDLLREELENFFLSFLYYSIEILINKFFFLF